ncbi:MAG: TonB-dependent receptor [Alphaproteobacteria bacterium]|nr:TonB-dependent receptor [Alphaproteobacteria bacterium]MBV9372121.1 TonB-dependent receptor [Alphaproteobacteria bacterium]MBV9901873.1 TonB-dependent receptor [Alphaproteobacteria bacterium]
MSKSFWLMSAGLCALASAPAHAQNNTTPTGETGPLQESAEVNPNRDVTPTDEVIDANDIVVTAQGRQQVLQDVPIAVSAVSAESLQNSGASDIRQLNQLAPSLLVSSTGTEANGSARIRGIGTVGDNPGLESSVAVFIDGVYRSRTGVGLNELGEIERVEVLRGPQGTLFGRNASAGLLNIISKKPNLNRMEGFAEATYGNYDAMRLSGGITGPLGGGGLGFRLDGVWTQRDGFLRNITAGGGSERRVNDRNRWFVRGQLLYQPNDQLEVRIIGDYSHRNESCCGAVYLSTAETTDPTPGVPGDFAVASSNRIVSVLQSLGGVIPPDPFARQIAITPGRTYKGVTRDAGISGQIDYKLGETATLTSITAYRDYKSDGPSDTDYSNVDILYRADDGNAFRAFKTFSQELRLQGSAFADKLDWLIGGYYAHEKLEVRDNLKFGSQYGAFAACRLVATVSPLAVLRNPANPGCLSPAATAPGSPFSSTGALGTAGPLIASGLVRLSTVNNVGDNPSRYFQTSENWAIFTHNIFNITDKVALTIGLRYTNESKDFRATFNNNNTVCPVQQAAFANFLTGGATALPAALQPLVAGIVNLTCQGNATSALNALNLSDSRDESEWTGTGILSWKPVDDLLLYGSYSKGYKAGGFNLDRSALGNPIFAPNDPRQAATGGFGTANLQFDPEKVTAYELGFKYGNRRITLNGALFYEEFRNFQLNTFNGSVFLVQNINGCSDSLGTADQDPSAATGACTAKHVTPGVVSQGVEIEAAVFPVRDLQITAGVTYADTHYKKDLVGRRTGAPLDPALFLLPGDHLSNAPNLVGTASLTWTPRIGSSGLSGLVYADARMSSAYNTGSDLFPEKEQNAFTVVNARVGIRGPEQKWALELWAQNLFNEDYQQVAFNTPFQGSNSRAQVQKFGAPSFATANQLFSSYLAEPRTYGITGRFRF